MEKKLSVDKSEFEKKALEHLGYNDLNIWNMMT